MGPCGDDELFRLMKSSKVFILPSLFEGWGISIAEALACGLPVICYDIPAVREVFGACKSVFLVPAKNINKLTSTILEVMNANIKELAIFSKEYVKSFSWNAVALKDLKIIKQTLKYFYSK
jgi:glycosyltransferase involved in cell wall biosynthesis